MPRRWPKVPASGRLVGGCLTVLQTTLGTGFAPNTSGAILVLEDRGLKPYQVDRALRHLYQAGIFEKVAGILLGDFPDCDPPSSCSPSFPRSARKSSARSMCPLSTALPSATDQAPYTHNSARRSREIAR